MPKKKSRPRRLELEKTVFVVGAGFSAGLGYPLVNDLLIRLWRELPRAEKWELEKVIKFHHPGFDAKRRTSFPNIETLLSEMSANEQLFNASRTAPTGFTIDNLVSIREGLLYRIAKWFHVIFEAIGSAQHEWLAKFKDKVSTSRAVIISFNWDLVIDHLMFENGITSENYGLGNPTEGGPVLIKPHGSLNWYNENQGKKISKLNRIDLHRGGSENVYAFTQFREPISSVNRRYSPLIVPPVFNKSFEREIFTPLWQRCVTEISTARNVVFIGYSLPDADLQARFILRCGFHNQVEGLPVTGGRARPSGPCAVTIVNPDIGAARRIEGVLGSHCSREWQPFTVERWLNGERA